MKNRSILAAMGGITTGNFARTCLNEGAGMVSIGGYPIGDDMILASQEIIQRGRQEFLLTPRREIEEIMGEIEVAGFVKDSLLSKLILNLRFNNLDDLNRFLTISHFLSKKPLIEINAHCRQPEVMQKGGGQSLLRRPHLLGEIIDAFKARDFTISLKFRGNAILAKEFIPYVKKWQPNYLHIDSYRLNEEGTDLALLKHYVLATSIPVIGNNSVVDRKSAQAILDTGARYFSIARSAQKDPSIFQRF